MIELIPIHDLQLLEDNPRKITEGQFLKLMKSLTEDPGFFNARPCLVNHDSKTGIYTVYAGNQRVRAAERIGWKEIPCIIETDISKTKMKARIAKDNKQYGEWDWDILSSTYDIDELLDCGFTAFDLGVTGITPGKEDLPEKKDKKNKTCPHCGENI